MIWEKLFVWEKLCLWLFKISTGLQDENPRSMACIAQSAQFGYHSNYDLQIYTKHPPPVKLPGHQSITPSVAITTQLWCHSISAMACNACHASEIFIIHTSANFEKSKLKFSQTNIFSQINKFFGFNIFPERIICEELVDHEGSVSLGGRLITNFRFADGMTVMQKRKKNSRPGRASRYNYNKVRHWDCSLQDQIPYCLRMFS